MSQPALLEAVKVQSYSELLELSPAETMRRLDAQDDQLLHSGDAFLAVVGLKAVGELADATRSLVDATKRLERVTYLLFGLTALLLVVELVK